MTLVVGPRDKRSSIWNNVGAAPGSTPKAVTDDGSSHESKGAGMSDFDSTDYSASGATEDVYYSSEEIALESEISEQMHETNMEIIDNMDGTDDYSYSETYDYDNDGTF